jgi:hypothetical protein
VHNNPLIYIDPTGHACQSANGDYFHYGDCSSETSLYIPDVMYASTTDRESDNYGKSFSDMYAQYEANDVFYIALGSVKYGVNQPLGVKGYSLRIDKAHESKTGQKHIHIMGPKNQQWSQNEDGSPHDQNKNSPGGPPNSMKKEIKKKLGWDWDANAKSYQDKVDQFNFEMTMLSLEYENIPDSVLVNLHAEIFNNGTNTRPINSNSKPTSRIKVTPRFVIP